jgi:3',5'-cyclic AMP phosphodiesterase CpdA
MGMYPVSYVVRKYDMSNEGWNEGGTLTRRNLLRGMAAFAATAALARGAAGRSLLASAAKPVHFALLGDWGNGDNNTTQIARQMLSAHDRTPLDMIVTAGDNIYPDGAAERFGEYFERPFEGLIKKNVPVYACLGNHDVRSGSDAQMRYPLFNMGGRNYYRKSAGDGTLDMFVLDSNMMDRRQVSWLEDELRRSTAAWKIAVFHHPPFSSGKKHGSDDGLQSVLHPIFVRNGVRAVFNGHDHFYQRVTPQDGVQYFVSGAGGKIRVGNLRMADRLVAAGYDDDSHFMLVDVDASRLAFRAINTGGKVVDEGVIAAPTARLAAA